MMKQNNDPAPPFGPSHSELPPKPELQFSLDRRKFFQLFGGGIAVAFVLHDLFSFAGEISPTEIPGVPINQVGAWIHIGEDGKVRVFTGKVEVGQNIRTSLSQIVAEELYVPVSNIEMVMGDTDLVPYDAGTFGSRTTPQMGTQLRKAAATLRLALLEMAAKNWDTEAKTLKAESGFIINPQTQSKVTYGALTKGQQLLMPINDDVPVRPASEWQVAGKTVSKIGGRDFITGRHQYVSNMKLPQMLYGKVLRAPSYGARLLEVDTTLAQAMPGVVVVRDGDFVGVAAPNARTADSALRAIKAKWEEKEHPVSSSNIFDHLVATAGEEGDRSSEKIKSDVEDGLKEADFTHHQKYSIHYIAHVPLEPRAAVAEWKDGKLTVWTGTQRPFGVQENLSEVFRLSKDHVRVIMPDTGSGYGGKHTGEAAIEAARLAQEAKKPVKVVWTRQEEFMWAYFRPAGVIEVQSGVLKDGSINAWKFINYNSGPAGLGIQYRVPHQQIAHIPSDTPLRQGSYRGLASPANVFARECHIEDLARLVQMDPYEFRMKNLEDERLKAVLEAAAKAFGWNKRQKMAGKGYGIACGFEKGGYVGTCVEVNVQADKQVKVVRIVQAFECGAIINPHHLEAQVMGSIIQGLGGALFEAIDFADGKIRNGSLAAYRVPRFSDVPDIQIITLDRKDLPSAGAGEAAIIAVAPATRNAILDATGISLNTLPLLPKSRLV